MAKQTISASAKSAGISRQSLYTNYINTGKISVCEEGKGRKYIDTSEILRVFGELKTVKPVLSDDTNNRHMLTQELDTLKQQNMQLLERLTELREREKTAMEREKWLQGQIETLSSSLKQIEHKTTDSRGFLARLFGGKK